MAGSKRALAAATALAMLIAGAPSPARAATGAVACSLDMAPAATLLLPYFEVDLRDPAKLTTLFAVQNMETISVTFWTWKLTAPVALVIVAVYFLGMLSGWTVVAFVGRSLRRVTEHPRD